jgi:hypothetical protein
MAHKFIVSSEAGRSKAIAILRNLPLEKPHEFSLKLYRKNRSIEQNQRYRKLLQLWSELGQPTDEIHEAMKIKFLIPILERDDEDFRQDIEEFRQMYLEGQKDRAMRMQQRLKARASTTWLNTKQFCEYTEAVEGEAAMDGVALNPDYK